MEIVASCNARFHRTDKEYKHLFDYRFSTPPLKGDVITLGNDEQDQVSGLEVQEWEVVKRGFEWGQLVLYLEPAGGSLRHA